MVTDGASIEHTSTVGDYISKDGSSATVLNADETKSTLHVDGSTETVLNADKVDTTFGTKSTLQTGAFYDSTEYVQKTVVMSTQRRG